MIAAVRLADAEPNGLAEMLAGLIEANLGRHPDRSRLLRSASVVLEARDAGVAATVRLRRRSVEVVNGAANPSSVRIRAASDELLALSAAPLRFGFPDALRPDGRRVLAGVIRGRVRIRGIVRHPIVLSRFARLLSVR